MRILFSVPLALSIVASLFAAPVVAQQTSPANQAAPERPQVVSRFDEQTVRYLLEDVQANWQVERSPDGGLTYRASAPGGLNFVAAPRSCGTEVGCVGLVLVALFDDVQVDDAARLDAFINGHNDKFPTAKVMRDAQGMIALQAYINAAYGISYRNAQAQLLVFGQDISALARALAEFEQSQ